MSSLIYPTGLAGGVTDVDVNPGTNITSTPKTGTASHPIFTINGPARVNSVTMVAGTNVTSIPNTGTAVDPIFTVNAATQGGGTARPMEFGGFIYLTATNTVGYLADGTVVSNLATTDANNLTVFHAMRDALKGTQSLPGAGNISGYGGGSCLAIAPGYYRFSTTIDWSAAYGVSVFGWGGIDRAGLSNYNQSMLGTVIAASSSLTGALLAIGASVAGGARSATNPHGTTWQGIAFTGYGSTASLYGVRIRDTGQLKFISCTFNGFRGTSAIGLRVESTASPDDGSLGGLIEDCYFSDNRTDIWGNGTGSTDWIVHKCRILQALSVSVDLGSTGGGGGWQILNCHLTSGSGITHLLLAGSPNIIVGNYFDTTGSGTTSYHIDISANGLIVANHFKCTTGSGPLAPIFFNGTGGRKVTVVGNTTIAGSNYSGLVTTTSVSGAKFAIVANQLDNTGGTLVSALIDTSGNDLRRIRSQTCNQTSQIVENAITFTNLPGMNFAVKSGRLYMLTVFGTFQTTATTTGAQLRFGTGAPTMSSFVGQVIIPATSPTGSVDSFFEGSPSAVSDQTLGLNVPTANVDFMYKYEAIFQPSADGTIQLQGRSELAGGQSATFQVYSGAEMLDLGYDAAQQFCEFNFDNDVV